MLQVDIIYLISHSVHNELDFPDHLLVCCLQDAKQLTFGLFCDLLALILLDARDNLVKLERIR